MATVEREKRRVESERPQFRVPRLADLREVVDKHVVDNFAVLWKIEIGEAGVNEGTYVASPFPDQGLILVFHQSARSFIREGKFGEHRHWKYDSFIGKIPDASSTDEEKLEFNKRISKVRRSPDFIVPAHEINGRVLADTQLLAARKVG